MSNNKNLLLDKNIGEASESMPLPANSKINNEICELLTLLLFSCAATASLVYLAVWLIEHHHSDKSQEHAEKYMDEHACTDSSGRGFHYFEYCPPHSEYKCHDLMFTGKNTTLINEKCPSKCETACSTDHSSDVYFLAGLILLLATGVCCTTATQFIKLYSSQTTQSRNPENLNNTQFHTISPPANLTPFAKSTHILHRPTPLKAEQTNHYQQLNEV